MTATLSFNLPEEKYEFDAAVNGDLWRSVVFDLCEELRRLTKDETYPLDCYTLYFVRDRIRELMKEDNLFFD